jgi:hypothetical protein
MATTVITKGQNIDIGTTLVLGANPKMRMMLATPHVCIQYVTFANSI